MVSGWIQSGLALFYSLFAGSLSDDFGLKPLIVVPLVGLLLSDFAMLLNYVFIERFPIEMFYLDKGWSLFGGNPVYLLGIVFKLGWLRFRIFDYHFIIFRQTN